MENNLTSKIVLRAIFASLFFSFIGYAFAGSWWFWNWHWIGIVVYFVLLIFVVLIALEEDMEDYINKNKN